MPACLASVTVKYPAINVTVENGVLTMDTPELDYEIELYDLKRLVKLIEIAEEIQ